MHNASCGVGRLQFVVFSRVCQLEFSDSLSSSTSGPFAACVMNDCASKKKNRLSFVREGFVMMAKRDIVISIRVYPSFTE